MVKCFHGLIQLRVKAETDFLKVFDAEYSQCIYAHAFARYYVQSDIEH